MKDTQATGSGRKRHGRGGKRGRKAGRRGARGRLFAAGEMRIAMLGLLDSGPAHGYELMRRLSDKTEGRYEPILQQLQDEGLADVETDDGKKVYKLTEDGVALVRESAEELEAIWQRAATWRQWSRLDSPELGGMKELKVLIAAILDRLQNSGNDPEIRDNIRIIVANAAEKIRKI